MSVNAWLAPLMPHLVLAPILLPLATAALMLLLGDTRRPVKAVINVLATTVSLLVSLALLYWVQHGCQPQAVAVYLPGNWPVPFGIVLVVDRLSAMMLLLTSVLGLATVLYAVTRWHKAGVHFHPPRNGRGRGRGPRPRCAPGRGRR